MSGRGGRRLLDKDVLGADAHTCVCVCARACLLPGSGSPDSSGCHTLRAHWVPPCCSGPFEEKTRLGGRVKKDMSLA